MKKVVNKAEKPNLLDLFFICNVPTSTKFQLFCMFLTAEDVYDHGYFEESQFDNFHFPGLPDLEEGYFDNTHFEYRCTEGVSLVEGFIFGTYDSYEEAVSAAKAYTAESLLEKYFAVYEDAKASYESLVGLE